MTLSQNSNRQGHTLFYPSDPGTPPNSRKDAADAARAKVTADSLIQQAEAVYQRAYETGQMNAANGAIKTKGILSGQWLERKEIGQPGEFDHLSDDELERLLV